MKINRFTDVECNAVSYDGIEKPSHREGSYTPCQKQDGDAEQKQPKPKRRSKPFGWIVFDNSKLLRTHLTTIVGPPLRKVTQPVPSHASLTPRTTQRCGIASSNSAGCR